jgi:hypothetical protein
MTPTPDEVLRLLETDLRSRGVPFSRAALQMFVGPAWTLILDDPDPGFWVQRFLETGSVVLVPS